MSHLRKFEVRHSDGTAVVIKATNEDMARQFAMENKYGHWIKNRTWPAEQWRGKGLSVREITHAE